MATRLPPLNSLRAFEAAARHMSFARAADELFVTQSAISHQVKQLEEHLDLKLFLRQNNALTLTDAGRAFLPQVREAFKHLAEATSSLKARDFENVLNLSVPPTFAAKWLRHRLFKFSEQNPELSVKLVATKGLVDFSREDFDAAIRYGRGEYPGLVAERFLGDEVFPVCSPTLLQGKFKLQSVTDLRRHTLLHVGHTPEDETAPDWTKWIHTMGVDGVDTRKGPIFTPAHLAIDAAIDAEGVALVKGTWVTQELGSGRLVRPFEETLPSPFSYFLVYPDGRDSARKLTVFRRWLFDQVGGSFVNDADPKAARGIAAA